MPIFDYLKNIKKSRIGRNNKRRSIRNDRIKVQNLPYRESVLTCFMVSTYHKTINKKMEGQEIRRKILERDILSPI
ncbi:hypothetical protein A9239_16810 [Methanosarcina sp. A14]|nr:hypothetical protein A9239_16810 [Methanosarcina sp. A14]